MLKPMLRANSVGRCRLRRFVRGGRGRRRGCYWEIKGGRSGVVLSLSSTATAIDPKPTKPRLSAAATRMPSAAPPPASAAYALPKRPQLHAGWLNPGLASLRRQLVFLFLESNRMPIPHFLFWSLRQRPKRRNVEKE